MKIENQIQMMKNIFFLLILISFCSCQVEHKQNADLLVVNAKVYTVNPDFETVEAFAVKGGEIIAVGTSAAIKEKYTAKNVRNAKGKSVYPGFFDDHAHFYGYGMQQQKVDLRDTKSFAEVVQKIVNFQKKRNVPFITGRGWDQNDWGNKDFPTKDTLDVLFPDTPIAVRRIDGHALLANQKALDMAGVTTETKAEGGEIGVKNGKLTGILIDNPMELVNSVIPKPNQQQEIDGLLEAQKKCLSLGLTTVTDAGLPVETIKLIDSLQQAEDLKIKLYPMIIYTDSLLQDYLDKGVWETERLNVRSVKVYGDGALGSRGAVMKQPYSDAAHHYGKLLISPKKFKKLAGRIANSDYQMNTHAIGDSANAVVLRTYDSVLKEKSNRRWRVEHAQVIDSPDFKYFSKNIIPSIQPTHATSDMYWAEDRLGEKRLKDAYAYKKMLDQAGIVALGTDFPVEKVSPFLTFYAAVARKDLEGFPADGFQNENALSREEALKGMTIWAAYANFKEEEKGSIEVGKKADFIILDQDIMTVSEEKIPDIKVFGTYINGEQVYSVSDNTEEN